jgi:hypothetical protein
MGELDYIFKCLDGPLSDILNEVLKGWKAPTVKVLGDQNAGKSTLMERLLMLPMFPIAPWLVHPVREIMPRHLSLPPPLPSSSESSSSPHL